VSDDDFFGGAFDFNRDGKTSDDEGFFAYLLLNDKLSESSPWGSSTAHPSGHRNNSRRNSDSLYIDCPSFSRAKLAMVCDNQHRTDVAIAVFLVIVLLLVAYAGGKLYIAASQSCNTAIEYISEGNYPLAYNVLNDCMDTEEVVALRAYSKAKSTTLLSAHDRARAVIYCLSAVNERYSGPYANEIRELRAEANDVLNS